MLCFALHSTLPKFALVNYIHTMKKSFFAISIISLLLLLFSCNSDFKVTYLEICPAQLTTTVGDTLQMTFSVVYEGGDFNDPNLIQVAWSSSDDAIVAVSDSGKIVTNATGMADITVTCENMSSTCSVTVTEEETPKPTETEATQN